MAQMNSFVGNFEHNYLRIKEHISVARDKECDILIFPELAITGYPPEDFLLKPAFISDNLKYLNRVKNLCKDIIVIIGFVNKKDNDLYNSAAIISDRKMVDIYDKINLPNYSVFDEKRYFKCGSKVSVYEVQGIRFGVGICEDIWVDNSPASLQAEYGGTEFIININASPYYVGKWKERLKILRKISKSTGNFILYDNMVGGQDEIVFDGSSLIVNPEGKIIATGKQFKEDSIISDIEVAGNRRGNNKKKIEKIIIKGFEFNEKKPLIRVKVEKFLSEVEEVYKALVLGTKDYALKNGFKKVIIGLSGGIDSALTAVIATDALGKENVTVVFMPSKFSSSESYKDAKRLADNLGVEFIVVSIKKIYNSYLKSLKPIFKGLPFNIAEENIQARIRGNILMAISNKFGFLVLTTGNKSEMSTGYATLYGDMAGGFAVIKDVPKTMVYRLAEFINRVEQYDLIPENILKKAPTAELRRNQKDSDSLPEYDLLDAILYQYIEKHLTYKEIVSKGFNSETVRKVISLVDRSEYKRRQAPPGIKITKVAFGKDRRMPITNGYRI